MGNVAKSLILAIQQLSDRAVLRILLKSIAITLLIFAVLGIAMWRLLELAIQTWFVELLPEDYSGTVAGIVAIGLGLAGAWFLFRIVAIAVMQFFADEIVATVERRHYPECAATARKLPFKEDLANSARGIGRALLFNALALPVAIVLFFTAIGPAVVFLMVNAVLLGRELTDMGWLRHRPSDQSPSPVSAFDRLLLGGGIAGIMAIPFANFLAPILGAAAGTHLVQLSKQNSP